VALQDDTMKQIRADYRTARISEKLRAMLALLETFTLHPEQMTAERVRAVVNAGVSKRAVREAFYVAFLFNTYDRLADTLGWELPDRAYYLKAGRRLLTHGYK
jgi:alkylhydroperoxidase family enzyme